jgi:cold shock CspA family protein
MLICWDYSYYSESGAIAETRTSRQLIEEVLYPIPMNERINKEPSTDIINGLFVKDKKEADVEHTGIIAKAISPVEDAGLVSTIFSIKEGFGFIKDEKINNIFFYYDTVTNRDFDELEVGMKVKYLCEEDMERSKREGAPRYRAHKVTVIE